MSPIDLLSSFSAWNTQRKSQVHSGNSPSSTSGADSQSLQKAIESLLQGFLEKLIKELSALQGAGKSDDSSSGSPSPAPSPSASPSAPVARACAFLGPFAGTVSHQHSHTGTERTGAGTRPGSCAAGSTARTRAGPGHGREQDPAFAGTRTDGNGHGQGPGVRPHLGTGPGARDGFTLGRHRHQAPANMKVTEPTGVEEVNKPIIVKAGTTYDGQGKLFNAGAGLNGGGTAETQLPMFILEPGASIKNLQFKGGDGIHLLGDAKLDNVHGLQTGDDFVTVDGAENKAVDAQRAGISAKDLPSGPAKVEITNSSFQNSHDKAIQINGDVDLKLKGIYADNIGRLAVTRGGYPITANVDISDSTLQNLKAFTFRFDSKHSTVNISNTDVDGGKTPVNVMAGDPSKVHGAGSVRQSVQTVG